MTKLTNKNWFAKLLSLFFALLLFLNANSLTQPIKNPTATELTSVVEDVPIKVIYDESKYYVAGYEETRTVYLSSGNKVLLDLETNEQTRSFRLEADLTEFKEGNYEVPIEITSLNSGLEATLNEEKLSVRIEKRETRSFNVTPKINDNLLKNGYTLSDITVDPAQVEITSGSGTLDQIAEVIAPIEDDRDLSDDLSKRVDLMALDKDGNVLGVIILPSSVNLTVHVEAPSKSVPLKIIQSGSIEKGIQSFNFTSEFGNITVSGPREVLAKLDEIELYIDTSGLTETTKDSYPIQAPDGVKVDPAVVEVTTTPVASEKTKTSTSKTEATTESSSR